LMICDMPKFPGSTCSGTSMALGIRVIAYCYFHHKNMYIRLYIRLVIPTLVTP